MADFYGRWIGRTDDPLVSLIERKTANGVERVKVRIWGVSEFSAEQKAAIWKAECKEAEDRAFEWARRLQEEGWPQGSRIVRCPGLSPTGAAVQAMEAFRRQRGTYVTSFVEFGSEQGTLLYDYLLSVRSLPAVQRW